MTNKEIRRRFMSDWNLRTMTLDCVAAELNITMAQLHRALWPIKMKHRLRYYKASILTWYVRTLALFKPKRTRWVVFLAGNQTRATQLVGVFKTQQAANHAVQHRMRPPLYGHYKVEEIMWEI